MIFCELILLLRYKQFCLCPFMSLSCQLISFKMLNNAICVFGQVAATTLMAVCQQIGPDLTALHVLPQLKELFDELAFSQEIAEGSASPVRSLKVSKPKIDGEVQIESRIDLV
jgi:WD repeat-containing protein 81